MRQDQKTTLGSIHINDRALEDIILNAIHSMGGVKIYPGNLTEQFYSLFSPKRYNGINIKVNEREEISIEVNVIVRYGIKIPEIGLSIQKAIKAAIDESLELNVHIKDINVNILGVERGGDK